MSAKNSVADYNAELEKYSDYVADRIKKVVEGIGPRESGCDSEHRAQEFVTADMKDYADEIRKEKFSLHPKAFMAWVTMDSIMVFISAILLLLVLFGVIQSTVVNIIMLVLSALAVAFFIGEFLLYKQMLDPIFPKKDTYNVVCSRKPKGEVKRRIILSGHVDSAYEWHYTYWGGGHLMVAVSAYAIIAMIAHLVMDILVLCGVTAAPLIIIMKVLGFVSIPGLILAMFFVGWKTVVPGANDNLTGVFASMAVMRFLKDNDIRFENTEVVSISMACEEAGLRGAKAFAKAHAAEYAAEEGVETVAICTDTLRDYNDMGVYNRDLTGTVKLDGQAVSLLKKGSEEAGLDLPFCSVFFGSSDAAALVQGGMKATLLAAMDPTPAQYYHTRLDTADNLDPKTIKAGLDTLISSVFIFDEQGLPKAEK